MFFTKNNEKIRRTHISKHNSMHENQAIVLMITGGKKWHYVAVKSLLVSLHWVILKNYGDY